MTKCSYCGAQELMPFTCKFCGEKFCRNHRLPENHECLGLQIFKEKRGREPEKWIYEPFHKKYKKIRPGRKIPKPMTERIYDYFRNMSPRKVLYLVLLIIAALLIWQAAAGF